MKLSLIFFYVLFGYISQAELPTESNKSELEAVCKLQKSKLNLSKDTLNNYCSCWVENILTTSQETQKLILDVYQEKISYEKFSDQNNPIAIFELGVVESCIENKNWRRESHSQK